MYFTLTGLEELFDCTLSSAKLADHLTQLGLEVDAILPVSPSFEGLKVVEILETSSHPDADRLTIATVFDGLEELQIVCGANNCKKGLKTILAPIGATLKDPDGRAHKIKKGKLRGIESFGMLVSLEEMGLEEESTGLVELSSEFQVGQIIDASFRDEILDISFTPNLGHAMSLLGLARELSCLLKKNFSFKKFPFKESSHSKINQRVTLSVLEPKHCPHYACRLIENLEVKPSPFWLKKKLHALGMKSINNVVDATNYVLYELGHPLHAFDFDTLIHQKIEVKSFSEEISFTTLDGIKRQVPAGTLFICDGEKPVAIAGVMGGKNSEVKMSTRSVLLEAAVFSPQSIRKASKALNLHTDAAKHFERGVDEKILSQVLDRAAGLIQMMAGGDLSKGLLTLSSSPYQTKKISLRPALIHRILGVEIHTKEILDILERLEFKPSPLRKKCIEVQVPSYRNDIQEEIDLVEEIARFYGFDQIIQEHPTAQITDLVDSELYTFELKAHQALLAEGLQEILTCDLISPEMSHLQSHPTEVLSALNFVSKDQSILRGSLLANHLHICKHNQGHQNTDLQFYEIGKIYFKRGDCFEEETRIALTLMGKETPFHYERKPFQKDFLSLKGHIENFLDSLQISNLSFQKSHHPFLHPGIQADLIFENKRVGYLGEVHPTRCRSFDLKQPVFFAELSATALMALTKPLGQITPLPTFPASERDWTVTCLEELEVGHLLAFIQSLDSRLLKEVYLLDLFRSERIGAHRKNVTLRFVYRNDKKTLSFEAVETEHAKMINEVLKKMNNLILQPV